MKFYAALAAALVLCACTSPNDTHIKTVKERIDGGETIVFSEKGSKLPNCKNSDDWNGFRGLAAPDRERMVIGKQQSHMAPGNRACYRIGSSIYLDERRPERGMVRIDSIALGRIDHVRQRDLKGRFFASREDFNAYLSGVKGKMDRDGAGYVYIVSFTYLAGSAVDEMAIKQRDAGPDYQETSADGQRLKGCNSDWKDFSVHPDFLSAIKSGALKSYYRMGNRNCLQQGQEAEVKEHFIGPALFKVKITKVKRFKIWDLKRGHFVLNGFDYAALEAHIKKENSTNPQEYITVMDFEMPDSPAAPGCGPVYLARPLETEEALILNGETAACLRTGSLVKVLVVTQVGADPTEIMAKVLQNEPMGNGFHMIRLQKVTEGGAL